jgi:anti-sigma B factor antagonist
MQLHEDPLIREQLIRNYLLKRLDAEAAESFEGHYLGCEECFEELRTTQLLIAGLSQSTLDARRLEDVLVLEFTNPAQLIRQSRALTELSKEVLQQKDTKVLIDLSRVSRIDSAGLGLLMRCYSHAVRNSGMLKLLNPNPEVQKLLELTKIDSVVESFDDERKALQSFRTN